MGKMSSLANIIFYFQNNQSVSVLVECHANDQSYGLCSQGSYRLVGKTSGVLVSYLNSHLSMKVYCGSLKERFVTLGDLKKGSWRKY